jgi:hypothetical protein
MERLMLVTSIRARLPRWSALAAITCGAMVLGAAKPWASLRASYFGGPWISIESPVNPYDNSTQGALFVVHTFRHQNPMDMGMAGTAEGLVDGQRRSVALDVAKTSRTGAYAVRRQWGEKGIWTIVITATPTDHGPGEKLQALVEIGADGSVGRVSVPRNDRGGMGTIAAADIDRGLRERAKAFVAVGAR